MKIQEITAYVIQVSKEAFDKVKSEQEWSLNPSNNNEIIIEINEENEESIAQALGAIDDIPNGMCILHVGE